jgi:hypothetical protein
MTTEQLLLETWRRLPEAMRQEVLDFAQFLAKRRSSTPTPTNPGSTTSELGDKLQSIRDHIVESGMPLLTREEIEQEILERRGGYQE